MTTRTGTIPCKQPRVLVDAFGDTRWQADCYVAGCRWSYGNVVKTDVAEQATRHRQAHRAAVPKSQVYLLPAGPNFQHNGYMAECDCGWHRDAPGVTSRADNQAALEYHLSTAHGLVA